MPIQHISELFALDGRAFVTEAYQNLLHREPDAHGLAYYLGRLSMGYGKAGVITQLAKSSECRPHDEIQGLQKLIADEQRAKHWFWGAFRRRNRQEENQKSALVGLSHIDQRLNLMLIQGQQIGNLTQQVAQWQAVNGKSASDKAQHNEIIQRLSMIENNFLLLKKDLNRQKRTKQTTPAIFIDVTSIFKWNRPPVGIIRTLIEVVRHSFECKIIPINYFVFNLTKDRISIVDKDLVDNLLYALENIQSGQPVRDRVFDIAKLALDFTEPLIPDAIYYLPYERDEFKNFFSPSRLLARSISCPFDASDTVISIGLDWDNSNYEIIHALKKLHKFKFVGAFYDGIPIRHPDFLPNTSFCNMFFDYFYRLSTLSDKIFTISNTSKKEYFSIIRDEKINGCKTVEFLRLGDTEKKLPFNFILKKSRNITESFVIYVSTIEKRKNHILLLDVWESLYARLGDKTPTLICIGMWGWGVDDVKDKYSSNHKMQEYIKFYDDVDGDELIWFYQNASFSVFPSHNEGWGLGASESLTHGLPCITSSTPAILEATQNLMPSCDSNDPASWLNEIEKMATDIEYVKSLRLLAREKYIPRTWNEFGEEFFKFCVSGGAE